MLTSTRDGHTTAKAATVRNSARPASSTLKRRFASGYSLARGLIILVLVACTWRGLPGTIPRRLTLPPPQIEVTRTPDPEATARAFLNAWREGAYAQMFEMLSSLSREAFTLDAITRRYQDAAVAATVSGVDFTILSTLTGVSSAEVRYQVTLHTAVFGEIARPTFMLLKNEQGSWRVVWDDALILPELKGGNTLVMNWAIPARGNIYDRTGKALAYETDAISLGVIPGQISDENTLLSELSRVLSKHPEVIRSMYAAALPDWYVPLGDVAMEAVKSRYEVLARLSGLVMRTSRTRYYYGEGIASHVVGYIAPIPKEDLGAYVSQGYPNDARVGVMGLERWGEALLAGKYGGELLAVSPAGTVVAEIAKSEPQPSRAIRTTLDRDLQTKVEGYGLGSFSGAIVMLDSHTGEVLAMVSAPGFDSNLFDATNYNRQFSFDQMLSDPRKPLFNRATQGQYPLGSVFKIITMSAALESGAYTPASLYTCDGYFRELPGLMLTDWTVARERPPHGTLDLVDGLIQSCDPFFWHIGLDLYGRDPWLVPNMARGFGLGKATGIDAVAEEEGLIPDPAWKQQTSGEDWTAGDALNEAIGQGHVLVTPLQVADFVAAVGNGGTLYRPQIVRSIQMEGVDPIFTFASEIRATLPVSAQNLEAVQRGMRGVVADPKGTARFVFYGWENKLAGKTGTAEDPGGLPDAWFVGYTYLNRSDKPDIAVAVVVENGGEGSEIAAPIFRRVIEIYFYGAPQTQYPWESEIGLTATPSVISMDGLHFRATEFPAP